MKEKVLDELSVEMRNAMLKVLQKKSNLKKMDKAEVTNFEVMGIMASAMLDVLTVKTELSEQEWTKIIATAFNNAIGE